MSRHLVVILLASPVVVAANANAQRGGRAFLATDGADRMRPELVAKTFSRVEEEWRTQAVAFTESNASEAKAAWSSFSQSCGTVVTAVVQASGGDRDIVKDYMGNVCGQKVLAGWPKQRCQELAMTISEHGMLADNWANRQILQPSKVCNAFWSKLVEAERNREAIEAKERAEQEKLRAEEDKKAAIAAAEAKKKADAEAAEKMKKEAEEKARREQEEQRAKAKQEAAEAKERAAAAAARLAQKKAEAEAVQRAAQQKLEEAAKAEKEHEARLAEHQKAEELLRHENVSTNSSEVSANYTVPVNATSEKGAEPAPANSTVPKSAVVPVKDSAAPKSAKKATKL